MSGGKFDFALRSYCFAKLPTFLGGRNETSGIEVTSVSLNKRRTGSAR
ncbi:MAG: hypothetical protein ACI89W_002051 [Gammaproteobacteria bacterium]|jgi:hypothetical protein